MRIPFNSVCMATYNGERFIIEQISSILKQINLDDELIISDDGSTDNTVNLIRDINDSRVKLFDDKVFRDPIKNFQNALQKCKGRYIFLSDQDDVWLDDKYQSMLDKLQSYDLVISDSYIVDEDLNVVHPSFFKYFNSGKGIFKNVWKSSYYGSCMAFHRKVLDHALPFPDTKEIGHDLWLGLVAELKYSVLFYEKPLIKYRRHPSAFTPATVGKSRRKFGDMIYGRIIMLRELSRFLLSNRQS